MARRELNWFVLQKDAVDWVEMVIKTMELDGKRTTDAPLLTVWTFPKFRVECHTDRTTRWAVDLVDLDDEVWHGW